MEARSLSRWPFPATASIVAYSSSLRVIRILISKKPVGWVRQRPVVMEPAAALADHMLAAWGRTARGRRSERRVQRDLS